MEAVFKYIQPPKAQDVLGAGFVRVIQLDTKGLAPLYYDEEGEQKFDNPITINPDRTVPAFWTPNTDIVCEYIRQDGFLVHSVEFTARVTVKVPYVPVDPPVDPNPEIDLPPRGDGNIGLWYLTDSEPAKSLLIDDITAAVVYDDWNNDDGKVARNLMIVSNADELAATVNFSVKGNPNANTLNMSYTVTIQWLDKENSGLNAGSKTFTILVPSVGSKGTIQASSRDQNQAYVNTGINHMVDQGNTILADTHSTYIQPALSTATYKSSQWMWRTGNQYWNAEIPSFKYTGNALRLQIQLPVTAPSSNVFIGQFKFNGSPYVGNTIRILDSNGVQIGVDRPLLYVDARNRVSNLSTGAATTVIYWNEKLFTYVVDLANSYVYVIDDEALTYERTLICAQLPSSFPIPVYIDQYTGAAYTNVMLTGYYRQDIGEMPIAQNFRIIVCNNNMTGFNALQPAAVELRTGHTLQNNGMDSKTFNVSVVGRPAATCNLTIREMTNNSIATRIMTGGQSATILTGPNQTPQILV